MVKRQRKGGTRMRATAERSTLLVPQFPVALRLRVKAKAVVEGRYMHEVFAELVERGLAQEEQFRGKGKRTGEVPMKIENHFSHYWLRMVNHTKGDIVQDTTQIPSLEKARQEAKELLSSGSYDEVEILDASENVVETVRQE
jgi:hypothetical protein